MIIKYILLQIVLLLILLIPFFSMANNSCADLFNAPTLAKGEIVYRYEDMMRDDFIISQIEDVRRQYDGKSDGVKSGATMRMLSVLKDVKDLQYEFPASESEKILFENTFFNLIQDFVHISPRFLNARRLFAENLAILKAMLASETSKTVNLPNDGNVVSLGKDRIKSNSEYYDARRKVFDLIDNYKYQEYVPKELRNERVEELLLADIRFLALPATDRAILASRVSNEMDKPEYEHVEIILERYFAAIKGKRDAN